MSPDPRKVQILLGVKADGVWGLVSERALDVAVGGFDGSSQIPPDYFAKLAKIESGNRPYVKSSTSSASGLYQFVRSTWLGEDGRWGSDSSQAFGGLRPSTEEQTTRAKTSTQKNADALAKAGIQVTTVSLYAAHFLGVGTAIRALGQPPETPIERVTSPDQRAANPSVLKSGSNVAAFVAWLERKTS